MVSSALQRTRRNHASPPMPRAEETALFTDLDGTLIDFAPAPDDVVIDAELPLLLRRLAAATGGALAVISGRPLQQIDELLQVPHLTLIGQHGAEVRRPDGAFEPAATTAAALEPARAQVAALAADVPSVRIEDKGIALAFHYRETPRAEPLAREMAAVALHHAGSGFELLHGNCVIELKSVRVDKGRALAGLMTLPPFVGRRPWMLGDDLTDEPAFAMAQALGGTGVIVSPGRPSVARASLPDVATARAWLARLAAPERR